jgi:hypothetical protein
MRPESVQNGTNNQRFEGINLRIIWIQVFPSDVLGLTIRTLEDIEEMITRTCLLKSFQIFKLRRKRSTIKIPRQLNFKGI